MLISQHRRSIENPGNFGDCLKGKNPLYDGYHSCSRSRLSGNLSHKTHPCSPAQKFLSAEAQSQIPAPSQRSFHNTCERGYDFQGWAIYTDGGTRIVDGETLAGWSVIARSLHGRIDLMFGPVVTTELVLPSLVPELTPTTLLK